MSCRAGRGSEAFREAETCVENVVFSEMGLMWYDAGVGIL